jgi:hypothetical protein
VHLGLEVAAALGARGARAAAAAGGPADDVGEDVAEAAEAAPERAGVEAAGAAEDPAGVVGLALLGVGQDRVRLLHLLEALLGRLVARVAVGVVLARELAVGLLDLLVGGLLVDAERRVGISHGRRHRYADTTTRAGRSTLPLAR